MSMRYRRPGSEFGLCRQVAHSSPVLCPVPRHGLQSVMRLNTGFGLSVMFTRHRLSPANKTRLSSCHGDSRVFPAAGGVISSHSSKHYKRRYCAYQSWDRQNEYYENSTHELSLKQRDPCGGWPHSSDTTMQTTSRKCGASSNTPKIRLPALIFRQDRQTP